jgi:hypothetical protein
MRHLNEEDLLDLADGARPESSTPHLASCESCRRQLADLRAVMSAAAAVDVPEPSPLFWQHLSARVREAVSNEERASRAAWTPSRFGWRMVVPLVALAAVVLAAAVTLRTELPRPVVARDGVTPRPAAVAAEATPGGDDAVSLADDVSLGLIANLAGDLDWDAAVEAGLATQAGAVDRAVLELSANERLELQRILKDELSRSGA